MRQYHVYTKELLQPLVESSLSVREVCQKLGIRDDGSPATLIADKIKLFNLDTGHFLGIRRNSGPNHKGGNKLALLEKVLIEDSSYPRFFLKLRLLREGLLENKCSECGQLPEWQGQILTMVLDHVNGINNDNRLKNLRLLCPNCNSQQETFAGKNKKRLRLIGATGRRRYLKSITTTSSNLVSSTGRVEDG